MLRVRASTNHLNFGRRICTSWVAQSFHRSAAWNVMVIQPKVIPRMAIARRLAGRVRISEQTAAFQS